MLPAMSLNQFAADVRVALLFCTRLPIPNAAPVTGADIARAGWALPVAGAIVGLIAAGVYWLAGLAGLPSLPAAGLTVAATLIVTGCLHEDGLADVADAFGGHTRERRLEIMRDSRVGTYGACALSMSILLRTAVLASVPPARVDGLAVGVGRPLPMSIAAAVLLGVIALFVALGPAAGFFAIVLLAAALALLAWLCIRQFGGQTGDVLGAVEQLGEIAILLVAAASLR
jgi:adenosylcobinamide-GDP ribazoletransferase